MKLLYLFIPTYFVLFISCSSTYTVTDKGSKQKITNEFNNYAPNKKVEVILNNDSTLIATEGAEIKNDSILLNYSPNYYPSKVKKNRLLSLNEIKEASYKNHWKGIGPGIYLGLTVGGIIGATGLVFKYKTSGNHPEKDYGTDTLLGSFSGIIIS